ncbi:hypothetical protein VTP01DRAFT_3509 [Rhizomucor pusillus]|uniref:uncharacterized protein n=1 Tax=Rhizomucor pusillus TaxID=4840 RepID=UPI003742B310
MPTQTRANKYIDCECTKCTAVDHFGNYCHKKQTPKHAREHLFLFSQFKPVLPPFPSAAVNNRRTLPAALSTQDNAAMAHNGDDAGMDMEVDMDSEPCDEARLILPLGTLRLDDGNNVFDDAEPEGEVDDAEQGNELFLDDDEYLRQEMTSNAIIEAFSARISQATGAAIEPLFRLPAKLSTLRKYAGYGTAASNITCYGAHTDASRLSTATWPLALSMELFQFLKAY